MLDGEELDEVLDGEELDEVLVGKELDEVLVVKVVEEMLDEEVLVEEMIDDEVLDTVGGPYWYTSNRSWPPHNSPAFPGHGKLHCELSAGTLPGLKLLPQ